MAVDLERRKCGECEAFIEKDGVDGLSGKGHCFDFPASGITETHRDFFAPQIGSLRLKTCFRSRFTPQAYLFELLVKQGRIDVV